MKKRRIGITVGAVVLVVGVVAGRERPTVDLIQERTAQVARADDGIDLERLRRNEASMPQNDPFAQKDFNPEKRVPVAAVSTSSSFFRLFIGAPVSVAS